MAQRSNTITIRTKVSARASALTSLACLLAILTFAATAHAQSFSVIYTLNGTTGGDFPNSGLISDRQGNLYGAAEGGTGNCEGGGCGIIFKLSRHGSGWIFNVLYDFTSLSDGVNIMAPLTIGPDGNLYGTTNRGGNQSCPNGGCGTVFKLSPQPIPCRAVFCQWRKTTLYEFTGGADGQYPLGQLMFDNAGNLYGTANTAAIGNPYYGSVFEMTPTHGSWTFNVLYDFLGGTAGGPNGGVVFDNQGNLWGFQGLGGEDNCGDPQLPDGCGSIYELSPSSSGWTETNVFGFSRSTGGGPSGTMIADQSGNFYGTLCFNGPAGGGGVFEFSPGGQFNLLYADAGNTSYCSGPYGGVVMDQAGNLYAADQSNGTGCGFAFGLSPRNGVWYFTNLHTFSHGSDGCNPVGPLALDPAANVYGADLTNAIFEITP